MEKNVNTINKIIGELSYRDYMAKKRKTKGKVKSYSLSAETMQAIDIKHDYLNGDISENDYKSFCLRYNLRTVND